MGYTHSGIVDECFFHFHVFSEKENIIFDLPGTSLKEEEGVLKK